MGKWCYTWKSKYIIMKKNNNLDLISEINLILNQMGLEPNNSFLVESKLLLSEGVTPDDAARAVCEWLGIGVKTSQEIGEMLEKNPIDIHLPKVGGGFDVLTIRNIDELVAAAATAQNFYKSTAFDAITALKKVFSNTKDLRSNLGKSILENDVNATISNFISRRNSTKAASVGASTNSTANNLFTTIKTNIDIELESLDNTLGRVNIDPAKVEVEFDDFVDQSTTKLSSEILGDGTKNLSDVIKTIEDKITVLENRSKIYQKFVDDTRKIIQESQITASEKSQISAMLDKVSAKGKSAIDKSIEDLEKLKKTTTDINLQKGKEAEETLTRDPEAENMYKADEEYGVFDISKITYGTLGIATKLTGKAFYAFNWLIDASVGKIVRGAGSKMKADSKLGNKFRNYDANLAKSIGDRYKTIHQTSLLWFDDILTQARINKLDGKEWVLDIWNYITTGERKSVNTFKETELKSKAILTEMLNLTRQFKSRGVFKQKTEYMVKMKTLMSDLEATFRNTTQKRVFNQQGIEQVQKLEELAKSFESLIDDMVAGEIEGAAELKVFWSESTSASGEISTFLQMCKWLDDAALKNGSKIGVNANITKYANWEDFLFFGNTLSKWMKEWSSTPFTKVQQEAQERFYNQSSEQTKELSEKIKNSDLDQNTKSAFGAILEELDFSGRIKNLMTYGHYMNADEIKRLFTIYGPFRGILVVGTREVITHTIAITILDAILELAFFLESVGARLFSDEEGQQNPVTFTIIDALEAMGDYTNNDKFRLFASELKDRVSADYWDVFVENFESILSNGSEYFTIPLFVQNASIVSGLMRSAGASEETIDAFINSEYSMYNSKAGEILGDVLQWIRDFKKERSIKYGEEGRENIIKKYQNDIDRISKTGFIYSGLSQTDTAQSIKKNQASEIEKDLGNLSTVGNANGFEMGQPKWFTDTFVDDDKKTKVIKEVFPSVLDYMDEPQGKYTFKDGVSYDFSYNLDNGGYSQHQPMAEKWWEENKGKIGIFDSINNIYYPIYGRGTISDEEFNKLDNENKIVKANVGTRAETTRSMILIYNPKDGKYYDFVLLGNVIPKDQLINILKTNDKKLRLQKALDEYEVKYKEIEQVEGKNLEKLYYNKSILDKKIEEYVDKGYDEEDSIYYQTYLRAYKMRYGTKDNNGNYVKWYDPVDKIKVTYIDYDEQIETALKEYNNKKNEIDRNFNQVVRGGSKQNTNENLTNYYSKIINEYLLVNNIKQNNMKNLKHKLIESKRFDEDDYKHWKDTFTFQSVDEKNPGQYKDVKLNMDDVMDRIPHYRKKYDEDDSFVRAVVDTHENVVRFMFTKDLANIREGYSPVGFAKILQQLREARGENEIWSVARPASGNWFLVKGDFTPKELMGMDLEKNEPADREPKKRENSLETLKKKELTSAEGLKNNEKSGFNELPKVVKEKLREKFNNGWTTEEPAKNLKSFYSDSEVKSVFGDSIKIYKLNTNSDFFDSISKYSDSLPIKRGFCRSIHLAKQNYNLSDENKNTIRSILKICNNKFNDFLGLSNMS